MNNISAIGYVREVVEKEYRKIEFTLPTYDEFGNNTVLVICKYWPGGDRNYLLSLPSGTQIAITGHLDFAEQFGTIVVIEQLYCLKKAQ